MEAVGLNIVADLDRDMQNVILSLVYGIQRSEWRSKMKSVNEEYRKVWNGEHAYWNPEHPMRIENYPAQWDPNYDGANGYYGREINHRMLPLDWYVDQDSIYSQLNIWNTKRHCWVAKLPPNY